MAINDPDESFDLIPYKPQSEIVRRGLDDLARLSKDVPSEIRVPEDAQTIEEAIRSAKVGDTVVPAAGNYLVNLEINKSIKIRSRSPSVILQAKDHYFPICSIKAPGCWVEFQGIDFIGKSDGHVALGIEILGGDISFNQCQFRDFPLYINEHGDLNNMDENEKRAITIHIQGPGSYLRVGKCVFEECDYAVEAVKCEKIELRCTLISGELDCNALSLVESQAFLSDNLIKDIGFGITLKDGSTLISNNDTLYNVNEAFHFLDDEKPSEARFRHATITSTYLVNFGIVRGRPPYIKPHVIVKESIIVLGSLGVNARFAASALHWEKPSYSIPNDIIFESRNILYCPPIFSRIDPKLGSLIGNRVSLRSESPALKSAYDGSNLGAWQGEIE